MEVMRTACALMLLLGWFWEDMMIFFKNTEDKKGKTITRPRASLSTALSASTGMSFDELTDDSVIEILSRLPPELVIGLKRVSKTWHGLISDSFLHRISGELSGLLVCKKGCQADRVTSLIYREPEDCYKFVKSLFPQFPFFHSGNLLDCCNGLLLFCDSNSETAFYHVCNITTNQWVTVPLPCSGMSFPDAALAFDPSESTSFKVVLFPCPNLNHPKANCLEIFSSETGKWVTSRFHLEESHDKAVWGSQCVYFNGAFFRLSKSKKLFKFVISKHASESNRIRSIDLPCISETNLSQCIGLNNNCLHYAVFDGLNLRIWMLRYYSCDCDSQKYKWELKHNVRRERLPKSRTSSWWIKPLAFHPVSDVIFIGYPSSHNHISIICYRPSCKKLKGHILVTDIDDDICAFPFVRSIVPLTRENLIKTWNRRQRWQLFFSSRKEDHHKRAPWRIHLASFLDSNPVRVIAILLLIIDLIITVLELSSSLLSCPPKKNKIEEVWYHWVGIAILSLLSAKIVALAVGLGSSFFRRPGYVVDGVVVMGALLLEVFLETKGGGLLVVVSLWRIVRVVESAFELSDETIEALIEGIVCQFEELREENRRLLETIAEKDEIIEKLKQELDQSRHR
ncbi:hypothetical protein F0562_035265 [Nyssa sinensis]|uniref:Uncharacterized protein n=1 Tax=Nyssa sinensis TaxID=561372 RepID=A0A5J5ADR6_9ASTE|nr:hypothetical protein F0562_035265 [Nyssa sinensis]